MAWSHPNHQLDLIYTSPAEQWESDGLPLGNGHFGALILGGVAEDRLRITHPGYRDADGALLPLGDLRIAQGHDPENARTFMRRLDLQTASVEVSYRDGRLRHRREYFASYPDRVLVGRIRAVRKGSINLEISWSPVSGASRVGSVAQAQYEEGTRRLLWDVRPPGVGKRTLSSEVSAQGFRAEVEFRLQGGSFEPAPSGAGVIIKDADEVTLLLTVSTVEGPEANPSALKALAHDDAVTLYQRHLPDYQEQFHSMYLTLEGGAKTQLATARRAESYAAMPEEDPGFEELLFQYGRYLLLASSRTESSSDLGSRGIWWFPPGEGLMDNRPAEAHEGLTTLLKAGAGPSQMAVKAAPGDNLFAFPDLGRWSGAREASLSQEMRRVIAMLRAVEKGNGDAAYSELRGLLQSAVSPNLLLGDQNVAANLAIVRGMTDLFAREIDGVIHWQGLRPRAWPDGSVVGLRTPTFEIAYVWQGEEFVEGYVTRLETGETRIRSTESMWLDRPGGEEARRLDSDANGVLSFRREKEVTMRLRAMSDDGESAE